MVNQPDPSFKDNYVKGVFVKKSRVIVFVMLSVLSQSVFAAWDGSVTGEIKTIEVTAGENYGFRVILTGNPQLCGNSHTWAYIKESDSNYQTYVSVLLAAKMGNKKVQLLTTKETSSGNEYCHIGYMRLK